MSDGAPALIILSGLPGSGKSYFCRKLAELLPEIVTLESDAIRASMFDEPTHSGGESARLFREVHTQMKDLLGDGQTVALDATNLVRRNRRRLYRIAEDAGARLIVVELTAPEDVIRERLTQREADIAAALDTDDNSTAGNDVYDRMIRTAQPIRRDHITVDTSQDITSALRQIAADIESGLKSAAPNPL